MSLVHGPPHVLLGGRPARPLLLRPGSRRVVLEPIAGHPGLTRTATRKHTEATMAPTAVHQYHPVSEAAPPPPTAPRAAAASSATSRAPRKARTVATSTPADASAPTAATAWRVRPRVTRTTPQAASATNPRAVASGALSEPVATARTATPAASADAVAQSLLPATAASVAPADAESDGRAEAAASHRARRSAAHRASKQVRSPVWQAGPSWSTLTSRVSPSQSSRTSLTHWRLPEVSPLTQYSWRDRLQNVVRPVVSVRRSASSSIQPSISTSPVSCCCTTAGTRPLASRLRRAAMAGSSAAELASIDSRSPVPARSPVSPGGLLGDPGRVQPGVDAALGDQLGVRAALHDPAPVDDEHLVGVLGGGQPVRDGDRGAPARSARSRARPIRTSGAGSTALVASSRTSRSGSARCARTSATSCRSPADSDSPRWPTGCRDPAAGPSSQSARPSSVDGGRDLVVGGIRAGRSGRWPAASRRRGSPPAAPSPPARAATANATVA